MPRGLPYDSFWTDAIRAQRCCAKLRKTRKARFRLAWTREPKNPDFRLSKDGEVVVCHDRHFARLTCGHPTRYSIRHLAERTWEELGQIELPYPAAGVPERLTPLPHRPRSSKLLYAKD